MTLQLVLMDDWFMHGKNRHKTRKHTKSDGGINFRDLARAVSASWKNVDPEVLNFVRVVAAMVLQRRDDLRDGAGTKSTKKYVVSTPEVKPKVVETVARGTPFPPNTLFSATTIYRDAGNVLFSGGMTATAMSRYIPFVSQASEDYFHKKTDTTRARHLTTQREAPLKSRQQDRWDWKEEREPLHESTRSYCQLCVGEISSEDATAPDDEVIKMW